jgi:hypothetical protein
MGRTYSRGSSAAIVWKYGEGWNYKYEGTFGGENWKLYTKCLLTILE